MKMSFNKSRKEVQNCMNLNQISITYKCMYHKQWDWSNISKNFATKFNTKTIHNLNWKIRFFKIKGILVFQQIKYINFKNTFQSLQMVIF